MNKIQEFFKTHKYAIIWTVCYIIFMWFILKWMFNFNIFSMENWFRLLHAQLRGFPGFVFGILILSALPMYIATTLIIVRTKKPLFSIKMPKFMEPVKEETDEDHNAAQIPEKIEEPPVNAAPTKTYPTELKEAFIRARTHIGPSPKSNFDLSNIAPQPQFLERTTEDTEENTSSLPLPNDFNLEDITDNDFESGIPSFTPVFSDINFDESDKNETVSQDIPTELISVTEHLINKGITFSVKDDMIYTKDSVIAVHNDSEFWVADEETWFAAGKHKPSPIKELLSKSLDKDIKPILYLAQTNILDLDTKISQWSESGIKVIQTLDELN